MPLKRGRRRFASRADPSPGQQQSGSFGSRFAFPADQLFFLLFGLLAIFSSSASLIPVCVFLPSRLRSSSAPMNLRCFSVFAGIVDLLGPALGATVLGMNVLY